MSRIDSKALQHFRSRLFELREELQQGSETGKEAAKPVELDQTLVGRVSRMDAMQGQAMAQAKQARDKQQLLKIAAALERIESGDYGYCLGCDEPINEKRLEFDPTITRCVNCAD